MPMLASHLYTADDFRSRARAEHLIDPPHGYGDHYLNPDLADLILGQQLRDAAVLIPIVDHPEGASLILTKRADSLRSHSGQIAFPGGRIDPEDVSPEAAALRESEEEIGLAPEKVEVIGRMPDYVSGSGYRIAPVFGIVSPGFRLSINPDEVDAAFEVPLSFLMDPANHSRLSRTWQDRQRYFYAMPFGERYIWGVTAGIIRTLYERLYAE
jgi:8-oxo-dGTP pyrophosphatase MutT (NUDIX family)